MTTQAELESNVQLPVEERRKPEDADEQLHDLLPTAPVRHLGVRDGKSRTLDEPARLYVDHFRA
jgi:hypothetical protein